MNNFHTKLKMLKNYLKIHIGEQHSQALMNTHAIKKAQ
jgi:hypothetical protein